jgi:hypothetical protein
MKKNRSLEANLQAAKTAVHEMMRYWHQWKEARNGEAKTLAIAGYVAAFTNCKVFIENYLKHLYPNEIKMPMKVAQDIRKLVTELDVIENTNDKKFSQAINNIDQLGRDAA